MNAFIARQPILNADRTVYAYEFLYRDSEENCFRETMNGSSATQTLVSNLWTEFDFQKLTGGRYAFINVTEDLLRSDFISYLDPKKVVIEILETVQGDAALLSHLMPFHEKGYLFALDDYTGEENILAELADIIKVDIRLTSPETQALISKQFPNKMLLAEKVEEEAEFLRLKQLNYTLFQGYYFSKAVVLSEKVVEIALGSYRKLWTAINKNEIDFEQLEDIINKDINLSYKLMSKINSMAYYRGHYLSTIRAALVRMGFQEVKRWILLLLLRDCFGQTGDSLAKLALTRAIFMAQLAELLYGASLQDDAYVVGLFSHIDAVAQQQLEEILETLSLSQSVRSALLGDAGALSDLLFFTKRYESGDWNFVSLWLKKHTIPPETLSSAYLDALSFAELEFS